GTAVPDRSATAGGTSWQAPDAPPAARVHRARAGEGARPVYSVASALSAGAEWGCPQRREGPVSWSGRGAGRCHCTALRPAPFGAARGGFRSSPTLRRVRPARGSCPGRPLRARARTARGPPTRGSGREARPRLGRAGTVVPVTGEPRSGTSPRTFDPCILRETPDARRDQPSRRSRTSAIPSSSLEDVTS